MSFLRSPKLPALTFICALLIAGTFLIAAKSAQSEDGSPNRTAQVSPASKVGVLLVSHGSRSDRWRAMLRDVETATRERITQMDSSLQSVKTAFMEYTEPSIATRLEEFDAEGYSDVIVVPLLLTVSTHSFDDIPTIMGQREDAMSRESLRSERIRIYRPQARVHLTRLLDFPAMLENNVLRRAKALSKDTSSEGAVLVAYGSADYDEEWRALMNRLGKALKDKGGIDTTTFSWCGHIVDYKTKPTEDAIGQVLATKETAIVIPILVAIDEMFQHKIIGGAVENVGLPGRIRYLPDAILPEPALDSWVVAIVDETMGLLKQELIAK